MNAEIADSRAKAPAGWIFFDGECRFCVATQRRWRRIFERRGFVWLPIQTPRTAERLGVMDRQLQEEMWLQLADGRKFSGVSAWRVLMRGVWWLWPIGFTLGLPVFHAAGRLLYRWIARNRHCLGGTCMIHPCNKAAPGAR